MEMGTDVYVYRGWSGGRIILSGRVLSMVQENADGRADGEEIFLQWRSFFASKRWGEWEKGIFNTAARQERFYGNVFIRESQGIRESRCGIRKII